MKIVTVWHDFTYFDNGDYRSGFAYGIQANCYYSDIRNGYLAEKVDIAKKKNETTVIQAAGRVGRKSEGKEYGTVIDIVDDFPMYRSWANKRKGYYKKIGVKV